ncbi:MAG: hypothetical protein JRN20_01025 [Nitrososphaerota archaeon]|nr:hypothetical protein [Nitrososphaerota archaeon]
MLGPKSYNVMNNGKSLDEGAATIGDCDEPHAAVASNACDVINAAALLEVGSKTGLSNSRIA